MSTLEKIGQRAKPFLDLGAERWRRTLNSGLENAADAADVAAEALLVHSDRQNSRNSYFEYQQLNPYQYSLPSPPLILPHYLQLMNSNERVANIPSALATDRLLPAAKLAAIGLGNVGQKLRKLSKGLD